MGSCVSNNSARNRRQLNKAEGKIVILNSNKTNQRFRLQLSKKLKEEEISKIPVIDIQKSELYIRRKAKNQKNSSALIL